MNTNYDNEELLRDMIDDAAPSDFRAALLNEMLQEVQHQKRKRQWTQRLVGAGCVVAAVGLCISLLLSSRQSTTSRPASLIVHSQPLGPASIVRTQSKGLDLIGSSLAQVELVHASEHTKLFEVVGDVELLSLLAGHPAALVRHGPGQAELVFVNQADRNGFPAQ